MDWMLLTELSSMFCGPWHPTVPPVEAGPAAESAGPAGRAGLVEPVELAELAELAEADLWIARQAYEFMAARALCEHCGARLGRKVSVAALHPERAVAVGARCRGWRRHRHTALVSRGRDGLRFGTLAPS